MAENADHVYTSDELVNKLTDFTNSLSDDTRASLDPKLLSSLEDVAAGIKQLSSRIDALKQTVNNIDKQNEDYKLKISAYAAEQADRMAEGLKKKEDENPAKQAVENLNKDEKPETAENKD